MKKIIPLDLPFLHRSQTLAAYLIPYSRGAVLVESGPGSTLPVLEAELAQNGFAARDVTHVLLTHIHLDHAGAAGYFASQGAQVFVHPRGCPHLVNPEKLIGSARRVFGDQMEALWGKFWPVDENRLTETSDGSEIRIGELEFLPLDTPGHAEHHVSYLFEDVCFSGDIVGISLPGPRFVHLPIVPPETDLGKWRDSLERLRQAGFGRIAPTHFGIHEHAASHLGMAARRLDSLREWVEEVMPEELPHPVLLDRYRAWLFEQGRQDGISEALLEEYESSSTSKMAVDGLYRYWHKVRRAGMDADP